MENGLGLYFFPQSYLLELSLGWFMLSAEIPVPESDVESACAFGVQFLMVTINWIMGFGAPSSKVGRGSGC